MLKATGKPRQEFEQEMSTKLQGVVTNVKQSRQHAKDLEHQVSETETKIQSFNQEFETLRHQLVAIQAKVYASGTTS